MISSLFILFVLFWVIFLTCRSVVSVLLSWILSYLVKKTFPKENVKITVDDFGYFCASGINVYVNENKIVRIEEIVVQFLWGEFRLQLQSTAKDITLETFHCRKSSVQNKSNDKVVIKGSITVGINLFSFNPPNELLHIAPETEHSDIKVSELTSVWLFARDAKATITGKLDGEDIISYDAAVATGDALVRYNSNMARLVFSFKNASVTFTPNINGSTSCNEQIATIEGLILMYKFQDGVLTSSHSRLKHTDVNLTSSIVSGLEGLVTKFVDENSEDSLDKGEVLEKTNSEASTTNEEESRENSEENCEVAMEAESITINVFSTDNLNHFELKLAFFILGSPDKNTIRWSINVPFELMFFNGEEKKSVLGSKIKSEGSVNPCVLKIEGEEFSRTSGTTKWDVSFHEGILVDIKPAYVNTLETFIKTYIELRSLQTSDSSLDDVAENIGVSSADDQSALHDDFGKMSCPQGICKISASICDITIDVSDTHDRKLLQVVMIYPKFSLSQDEEKRNLSFKIKSLKGFNCVENISFFHPTDSNEKAPSLELSIMEKLSSDRNKLSFEQFSFGSCDTTVVVEETLIFAIMKNFGLHKKVAQIFFESRSEKNADNSSPSPKRFYFEHIELRAVEVILTLLPAIELPVELQVVKNNLGIPHQLPPRVENACLYFDAFMRDTIQYGSYKYISYDIKNHYLKELGSQSARVLGSMHLLGNISRLKQDIMSGFTTLRETGEFITFFRQVTTGVASSYSKFTGSWSDLFGLNSPAAQLAPGHERRHSEPSDLDVAVLRQLSDECAESFQGHSKPKRRYEDDSAVFDADEASECIWLNSSVLPDLTDETDGLNWDTESSDGEGNLGIPLDLIPRNVKRQLKGQEFLRRLKENVGDNEHGEVFACCYKVRKNVEDAKLNALLSNRKVYFLNGQPSHESLVLCVKYETLYKAECQFQDKTHYVQLISKMKGIKTLSIPSRKPSESPLVRCDNIAIARKVSNKINELKRKYDHEIMHSQHS